MVDTVNCRFLSINISVTQAISFMNYPHAFSVCLFLFILLSLPLLFLRHIIIFTLLYLLCIISTSTFLLQMHQRTQLHVCSNSRFLQIYLYSFSPSMTDRILFTFKLIISLTDFQIRKLNISLLTFVCVVATRSSYSLTVFTIFPLGFSNGVPKKYKMTSASFSSCWSSKLTFFLAQVLRKVAPIPARNFWEKYNTSGEVTIFLTNCSTQ